MKKSLAYAAFAAIALVSCQRLPELSEPAQVNVSSVVFTATTESGTRTTLSENGAFLDVLWQDGDRIAVVDAAGNTGIFSTTSTSASGEFTYVSGPESYVPDYTAYYPASLWNGTKAVLPSRQEYVAGNIAEAPMRAVSSTHDLAFKNLCGIIRLNLTTSMPDKKVRMITLSADQGMSGAFSVEDFAAVASARNVSLYCGEEGVAIGATPVPFLIAVPAAAYTHFKVTVWTSDGCYQSRSAKAAVNVTRSNITDIALAFNNITASIIELGETETANCYIVPQMGSYRFKATPRGNGLADLGGITKELEETSIVKAELVWATFNTTVAPEEDELIRDIRYEDGYVYFSTGLSYREGNALVAVKDASDNILWSWHLWFESDDLDALAHTYPGPGYVVMDRNLGALTNCYSADDALDFGFAYQNGRKDPFMMSATRTIYTPLGVLGTYTSSAGSSNVASSIQRPTVVFGTDSWGGSPDLWTASDKTIFDPCPPGWHVGPSNLWSISGFSASSFKPRDNDWNTYHGCLFNGEAWYPASGDRWGANHNNTGSNIRVWTRGGGKALASNNGGSPNTGDGSNPGHGYNVRCVRSKPLEEISTEPGAANTFLITRAGTFSVDATIKGNGGLDPLTGKKAERFDKTRIADVKVLWEIGAQGRAIKHDGTAYDIRCSDGTIILNTPDELVPGAAYVAVCDAADRILWSWLIWTSPEVGTVGHNGKTFMDRNLGAIDPGNGMRGFLYQWGRKDPFSAATGAYASFTFVPELNTAFSTQNGTASMAFTIANPTVHINNGDPNSWMTVDEYNTLPWRDGLKTIYDPCPDGWRVPTADEQNGFSGLPGTGFSNSINAFGNPGDGYYRSTTVTSYPKAYAFRGSGQRNEWGTNPAMAIRCVKE